MTESDPAAPILEKVTPEVRLLMQQLRALIAEILPQTTGRPNLGWHTIMYMMGTSMRDFVVAISPQTAYVNLQFSDGVDLPDTAKRLEGTGKRMRHVKIRRPEDVTNPEVRALLEAAARHRGLRPEHR